MWVLEKAEKAEKAEIKAVPNCEFILIGIALLNLRGLSGELKMLINHVVWVL